MKLANSLHCSFVFSGQHFSVKHIYFAASHVLLLMVAIVQTNLKKIPKSYFTICEDIRATLRHKANVMYFSSFLFLFSCYFLYSFDFKNDSISNLFAIVMKVVSITNLAHMPTDANL